MIKLLQPLAIFLIMYGMGLTLVWDDFRRVLMYPISITIGILLKVVVFPIAMFFSLKFIPVSPEMAVGFILLSALPGGAFSNPISLLAKGNVALSITLTALASFITAFSIPVILDLSLDYYLHEHTRVPFKFLEAIRDILLMTVIPVSLGMLSRRKWPQLADKAQKPFILVSAVSLSVVLGLALILQWDQIKETFMICGIMAIAVNLFAATIGFFSCRLIGIDFPQSLTVGIEVSVINTVLGITVAGVTLNQPEIGIPSTVYSLCMLPSIILAIISGNIKRRERRNSPDADTHGL